jgi:transcriptional regulator GlxA family with amidase domain
MKNMEIVFMVILLTSIKSDSTPDLILIPSFSTSNMQETIQKNAAFIPWLIKQYQNGAEIGSFCTGAFLLGATKLLDGRIATTHVDALRAFANAYPNITLKIDKNRYRRQEDLYKRRFYFFISPAAASCSKTLRERYCSSHRQNICH